MRTEAVELVDGLWQDTDEDWPPVLCLCRDDWHEGVVGLIAGRIKDRCHRPTIAFAPAGDGELKGSGRSIAGFHLRDALADIDARAPGLIHRFGGHAMAAGLTLSRARLAEFEELWVDVSRSRLEQADLEQKILSDGPLAAGHMTLPVARLLREAAPWGQGFPEPCFDGAFELVDVRVLKDVHLKLRLRPSDGDGTIEAIAFNAADTDWRVGTTRTIAYRLDVNDYFADPRVQLVVQHIAEPDSSVIDES
jgi:single-stranded-DNA-specific exonuclease